MFGSQKWHSASDALPVAQRITKGTTNQCCGFAVHRGNRDAEHNLSKKQKHI